MKKRCIILLTLWTLSSTIVMSCHDYANSNMTQESEQDSIHLKENEFNQQQNAYHSIEGIYVYKDNAIELEISITGEMWTGKIMFISGFGPAYDEQNAQYDYGVVKGHDLYESAGMISIGHVYDHTLVTSVGGHTVILRKISL